MPLGWKIVDECTARMIAISIHQEHYSHTLLMQERECVLAWPVKEMIDGVLLCGSVTGLAADKLSLTGWQSGLLQR